MKKFLATIVLFLAVALPSFAAIPAIDDHTATEEAEGKLIFEQLQKKEITCEKLTEENFDMLGEYFMGTMMGTAHEQMNTMITTMMGATGEKQMHVTMGKRMSGCNTDAAFPVSMMNANMMPMMMGMMGGGMMRWTPHANVHNNNMMGSFGFPFMANWGWFGPLFMLAFWALVIWGIVTLFRGKSGHGCCGGHNAEHDKEHKQ